ncbi:MAG: asparagine synthase [Chromatiales bacterium]|nr:asparagine synthase [Chromatiales bacterium]
MADMFGIWSPGQPAGSPAAAWRAPSRASVDGVEICIDGQPRYGTGPPPSGESPAGTLLRAYRDHGDEVFRSVTGPFAAVIVDTRRQRALLAVDRVGIRPLSYALTPEGGLAFGSSALAVAEAAAGPAGVRLDPQAVYDYMYLHMVPSPATVYPGVRKVPPAGRVILAAGRLLEERYWQPEFPRRTGGDARALGEELHRRLRVAVERALAGAVNPGAFLSGGLDSSTVVGVLAQLVPVPARTFSVGFNTEGYDELAFARLAVSRFGARGEEYIVTPEDVAAALPVIAGAYDEPFGNSSAIPTYFCARMAHGAGIDRLLAGDGGDEIFAGNPHYTRQALFEHYWRLPGPLRSGLLEKGLLKWVPEDAAWPLGKLRSYVQQASIPLPKRLHSWNFMFREAPTSIFTAGFLDRIDQDHPVAVMDATWAEVPDAPVLDKLLYFDWKFVLADNDLRKVGRMCELGGVEVRYPMLDTELLDFSLRIPAQLKIRGQNLRHFYKEAMRGFLPDQIVDKTKHGFGLPFGVWLKSSPGLIRLAADTLASLATRDIFRPDFLAGIQAQHRDGHPGYYGYVIWDLLMLEQWLAARRLGL